MSTQSGQVRYQLCQMVLVNAGTNLHVPSGRITAIDPRGGAAVLGDNGVGKTTTLRILPLFFGHLPSQIIAAGNGQEAMVRFILPTDASAIAFEYQRGSDDPESLRLAVIRRRGDDPDVPFYRLYRSGFRKDLFVDSGRFLTDDETQQKATALGIQTTSKLTTAEYRSVILRVQASSKDKERLRRYAVEWSFGPKQLDNLDRVVAAMVKKHISFQDIVQVAVGLVQQDLGQGGERAKLTFKQGKAPIERWLRNREACAEAFKLAPKILELEQDLAEHREIELQCRAFRSDVAALKSARLGEEAEIKAARERDGIARAAALEVEKATRGQLKESTASVAKISSDANAEYGEAERARQRFTAQRASRWEMRMLRLANLRESVGALRDQIEVAEASQGQAVSKYERLANEANASASALRLGLEKSKTPHQSRQTEALEQISLAEKEALSAVDEEFRARRQQLDDESSAVQEKIGACSARKASPAVSDEATKALSEANDRLHAHLEAKNAAQQAVGEAEGAQRSARTAFESQEANERKARNELLSAQTMLSQAKALHNPQSGTFLAALRASPDGGWKQNLAKVIDVNLLGREDLAPAMLSDAAQALYGWDIDTSGIASPEWTDDASTREAVGAAQQRVSSAEAHLEKQKTELATLSARLEEAKAVLREAEAKLSVLTSQTQERKNQVAIANQRVEADRRDIRSEAEKELAKLQRSAADIASQRKALNAEQDDARKRVNLLFNAQRDQVRAACADAIKSINESIARLDIELQAKVAALQAQLNEHLSQSGVDVNRLNALRRREGRLRATIRAREERITLVEAWQQWLRVGGDARVESLKEKAAQTAKQSAAVAAKLAEFELQATEAERSYQKLLSARNERLDAIAEEQRVLTESDEEFNGYIAFGDAAVDLATPAKDLRQKGRGLLSRKTTTESAINRRFSSSYQTLTARSSAVKELVEATLGHGAESSVGRAASLCSCYKLIGPQVATDVNNTLRTLLANIGALQKAIHAFEKEVGTFNNRLQEGLTEVKCFERVKDLRLDLMTNFDGLGFYKKLPHLEEIVRKHAAEVGVDYARELPPDETARALGDFMTVLGSDGHIEVNLSSHITLKGSLTNNGQFKEFKRASELENISSEGLTSLVLITLMTALLNTIRGSEPVHVPWVTDEVGKFDPKNFRALIQRLRDNRIDVVTASPELGPTQQAMFSQRYLFEDRGRIRVYQSVDGGLVGTHA